MSRKYHLTGFSANATLKCYSNGATDPDIYAAGFDVNMHFDDQILNFELQPATATSLAASPPPHPPNRSSYGVCTPLKHTSEICLTPYNKLLHVLIERRRRKCTRSSSLRVFLRQRTPLARSNRRWEKPANTSERHSHRKSANIRSRKKAQENENRLRCEDRTY